MTRHCFALVSVLAVLAQGVFAHTVWIEPLGGNLVVRFAEPGDDFEQSPGHLDSLAPLTAFIVVTSTSATIEAPRKSDHFSLGATTPTNTACVETIFTVRG